MSDPLGVLPLALAAGGGRVDGLPASELVAAGITLLQRSAPLVRALAGRRSAILLPTGSAFVTALAASEGRGAVLVNPLAAPPEVACHLRDAGVGAVLTTSDLAARLPAGMPQVHLEDAPRRARVLADGRVKEVDLGTHFGLELAGETDAPGRDEEAVIIYRSATTGTQLGVVLTHRDVLANARAVIDAVGITADDHLLAVLPFSHLFGLVVTVVAPLLAGARITTADRFEPRHALTALETAGITVLAGVPAVFAALVAAIERRGTPLHAGALRLCICSGPPLPVTLEDRWAELTGVELRRDYGLTRPM